MSQETSAPALWGGRFEGGPDPLFREINDSLPVDWALLRQDVAGSIAWAEAIGQTGVLTADEVAAIAKSLCEVYAHGVTLPGPPIESGAEDIHTWVESELTARTGDLGKKLHTGRSRNDQVATDLRLWAKEALAQRIAELTRLRTALLDLAARSDGVAIPAYTHLQPAQPVLAAHWCLAYDAMLARDAKRLRDAYDAADVCPLGSAALAGTTYPVDREAIAKRLGFARVSTNSLDAVSDRDFVLDALSAAAITGLHLSRIAEELIIYASLEFGMIDLEDAVTSGSSLMPQKKNPDALELLRGKAGSLLGRFQSIAVTLKGLPLAYNKDLQEDKPALFAAMAELSLCLRAGERVIKGVSFRAERCSKAAVAGGSNATELADDLVAKGVPFRAAHDIVGKAVRLAEAEGVGLEGLSLDQLRSVDERFDQASLDCLALDAILSKRDIPGGTAPSRVAAALSEARGSLAADPIPAMPGLVTDPASA